MSSSAKRSAEERIAISKAGVRVRVRFNGETVAESDRARVMEETGYPPVIYVPLADVRREFLEESDHTTHCPYKGDAAYWHLVVGDSTAENAVWTYPTPIPEVADIDGYVAFYTDKVDAIDSDA